MSGRSRLQSTRAAIPGGRHSSTSIAERTVRLKLSELADEGAIATRKVGSGRVWWPVNADDQTEESES